MDTDLALLERWRAGDNAAGGELYKRHARDILRFFDGKVGNRAEDLAQQTFLECQTAIERFRGESSFRTYLFAIAWNQLRHHLRSEVKDENVDFDVSSLDDLEARLTSPSSLVNRARRSEQLHQALARIPVKQQILLEHHYWHGHTAADLEVILGIPANDVRVYLWRARNALRKQLERMGQWAPTPDAADALTLSLMQLEDEDRRLESVESQT